MSLTSHWLTKARCLQGGLSRAVRPCAGEVASASPRAVLCARTWYPWELRTYLLVVTQPGGGVKGQSGESGK